MSLADHIQERIRRDGPLSFHDYMEAVLYHPELGYYTAAKPRIGIEGDFYTAPDLDPILGKLLARQFLAWSRESAGFTDNFTIVELGAGKGVLARDILTLHRFPYRILEISSAMRARQQEMLRGFDVEWIDHLPAELSGCVFSNEFFDALPVRRFVGRGGAVKEIFVGPDFTEIERDSIPPPGLVLGDGQIADIQPAARGWVRSIAHCLSRGFHVAIDYGYPAAELFARRRGTLMCYWRHQVHENPYIHIGEQDITAHVNFSDLIDEGAACGLDLVRLSTQKDFLVDAGILEEMQQLAIAGSAQAMQRLLKIKTLIVPGQMGDRFKVLVQRKASAANSR